MKKVLSRVLEKMYWSVYNSRTVSYDQAMLKVLALHYLTQWERSLNA